MVGGAQGALAMIVADTDVLIDALAGRNPSCDRVRELVRGRRLATTAITRLELGSGASTPEGREQVDTLLQAVAILPFDKEAADEASRVAVRLRESGIPIGLADLAIAGICLALEAPLLTRNLRHFERVQGLRLDRLN